MKNLTFRSITVFFALLIALGALPNAPAARAYEPQRDYWFSEAITVGDTQLPDGVSVHASDPASQPRASLVLENQSDQPLYVLSLSYKPVLVMATPDPLWKSRLAGAHEVASYFVAAGKPRYLDMEALADLDPALVDRNVLSMDPPPGNLPIPAGQNSQLLLVYGEQVLLVPFSIRYSLNAQFDSGSQAYQVFMANVQASNDASTTPVAAATQAQVTLQNGIAFGMVSLVVVFFSLLVWKKMFRG